MTNDKRIVLTLDAGGTNFRFSAIKGGKTIANPVHLPAHANTLDEMLDKIVAGFQALIDQLKETPSAISFAFPGPADYEKGIRNPRDNNGAPPIAQLRTGHAWQALCIIYLGFLASLFRMQRGIKEAG